MMLLSPGTLRCIPSLRAPRVPPPSYWAGAGIGRMLDTFQPPGVLTRIRFIKNRVGCAGCPAAPIVNMIGTYSCAAPFPSIVVFRLEATGWLADRLSQ